MRSKFLSRQPATAWLTAPVKGKVRQALLVAALLTTLPTSTVPTVALADTIGPGDKPIVLQPSATLSLPASPTLAPVVAKAPESSAILSAAGKVLTRAQELAVYALGMIGVNYKFGGNSPDSGLDCSGLVRHVFQQVTGVTLPRSAKEMSRLGDKVSMQELMPGDLVFFNTRRFQFSHVGIYLGDNKFIHAPSSGGDVEITSLADSYWKKSFNGARRIVGTLAGDAPQVSTTGAAPQVR